MATSILFSKNKRAKADWEGNYAGLILIIIFSAGIIGYLLLVSPMERERLNIIPEKYTRTLLDISPGMVSTSDSGTRPAEFDFGSISLDYSVQTFKDILKSTLTVKKSSFSDSSVKVPITVRQNPEAIFLQAIVTDKAGSGKMIVYLNDYELFSQEVEKNQILKIPVPLSLLQATNTIEFSVSSPGLKFWEASLYSLADVTLATSTYVSARSLSSQTFTLSGEQAGNAQRAVLRLYVSRVSQASANYKVRINGQEIYSSTRAGTIEIDVPVGVLKGGPNTVEFVVEKDGAYRISFASLTVDYFVATATAKTYSFLVNDYNWNQISSNGLNCIISISKASGGEAANVQLNNYGLKFGFADSVSEQGVCKYLVRGDNKLVLTADSPIELSSLKVTVSAKQ